MSDCEKHDREENYLRKGLVKLIEKHGTDTVARACKLTPRTVLEYCGQSARMIPLGKLEQAKKVLEGYEQK